MKWIKASEKTPEKDGYYITVCRCEDNDMVLPLTTSDTYFTNNEWKDTYGWEVIKWLDETDTDNWISVENELPEKSIMCLVYKYEFVDCMGEAFFNYNTKQFEFSTSLLNCENPFYSTNWEDGYNVLEGITHWQPLPTPPNK